MLSSVLTVLGSRLIVLAVLGCRLDVVGDGLFSALRPLKKVTRHPYSEVFMPMALAMVLRDLLPVRWPMRYTRPCSCFRRGALPSGL